MMNIEIHILAGCREVIDILFVVLWKFIILLVAHNPPSPTYMLIK